MPENAPKELIHRYGSKNGFNEQIGKIRAIISVRTPLDGELLEARNTFLPMAGMMFCILFVVIVGGGTFLLNTITKPVNKIIHGLTNVSKYVDLGSTQVTSASKSLSDRASEQAASIEETSSSLEEMSSMTKQNAGNASQANSLMKEANQVVEQANHSMAALTDSMEEISKASEETSKIIKTIDEIAFQTNLLALNAAVEAARAGEAGAGFAVVADEVRNLAIRAAQAAKNTADLIEGTMKKVSDGSELVAKTNEDFNQVATNSSKVGELVAEIATASNEQAQGILQANDVMAAMDQVVQQVAGTAEESASSSEEMNAYAQQMKKLVDELAGLVGEKKYKASGFGKAEVIEKKKTPEEKAFTTFAKYSSLTKDPAIQRVKEIAPDKVIPMDDDFKDF